MYPGKVDRVQLGLPIGNKSCLFRLVELQKSVGANLGQNKPDIRSNHKWRHPEWMFWQTISLSLSWKEDRVRVGRPIGNKILLSMLVKLDNFLKNQIFQQPPPPRKYQISKIELYNQNKSCHTTCKDFKNVFNVQFRIFKFQIFKFQIFKFRIFYSKFSDSKCLNSEFSNSELSNSEFSNSKFLNSKFSNSEFSYSEFSNMDTSNSEFSILEVSNSEFSNS